MTYNKLLEIFELWGFRLKTEHYWDFKQYCYQMLSKKRMIVVTDENGVIAVLFFFLTGDYGKVYKKGEFEVVEDNEFGSQMYIDKMICKRWTPTVRRSIQELIEREFPHVTEAFYHRAPKDRCVKINRRAQLCTK